MPENVYDVIIVGAGPAGTMAALHLAQHGASVAIVDKDDFPRDKPCGGGLTPRVLARFPDLSASVNRVVLNRPHRLRFMAPDRSGMTYEHETPIALMVRRNDFDGMLLRLCREAGAAIIMPARFAALQRAPERIDIRLEDGRTLSAKALVGADGTNSAVATQAGLRTKWARDDLAVSLVSELPQAACHWRDHASVHIVYGADGFGYGWVFPKGEWVNIGVCGLLCPKPALPLKAAYQTLFHDLREAGLLSAEGGPFPVRGGIIPIKGVLDATQADRVLICGDAAGFAHAVSGEGIYYAMVSGRLAAETLLTALKHGDASKAALAAYQTAWQQEIGVEIAQSVRIQRRLIQHPSAITSIIHMAARHDGIKQAFTRYFLGTLAYADLKRTLLRHFLPQYLKLQAARMRDRLSRFRWR